MKKLKLDIQQMKNVETLTREQLKNVFGGVETTFSITCSCDDGSSGTITCNSTQNCIDNCVSFCG